MEKYDLIKEDIPDIINGAMKKKNEDMGVSKAKVEQIMAIGVKFVKERKLIVYGGTAINELLLLKNKKMAIYDENDIPDWDMYTPQPMVDLIELCNRFYKAGFTDVSGIEAKHGNTYRIFIEDVNYFDLTYVPKEAYHRLPFREIKGVRYIDVNYMFIDMYKQYLDVYEYDWRLEKAFKRGSLLEEYYPFPKPNEKWKKDEWKNKEVILYIYANYIQDNNGVVLSGDYAYNYYIRNSKMDKIDEMRKPVNTLRVVSNNFKNDVPWVKKVLMKKFGKENVETQEYVPYLGVLGRRVEYKYKGDTVLDIYENDGLCIPFKKVHGGSVNISSYHYLLRMYYIMLSRARVKRNKEGMVENRWIIYNLKKARENYLKVGGYVGTEPMLFQQFQLSCVGEKITSEKLWKDKINKRKKEGKAYTFRYEPSNKLLESSHGESYRFDNLSGNKVKK